MDVLSWEKPIESACETKMSVLRKQRCLSSKFSFLFMVPLIPFSLLSTIYDSCPLTIPLLTGPKKISDSRKSSAKRPVEDPEKKRRTQLFSAQIAKKKKKKTGFAITKTTEKRA